jgi:ATP-binding cassette subfamily F protein 3
MHFSFPPAPHSGKIVLEVQNLGKAYGERSVLRGLEYTFLRGEKIAVAGRNGMGKSTLMRILAGKDHAFEGTLRWGTEVKAAWFSQDHEKSLDPAKTVLEEVESEAPTSMIPRLRDLLGSFLFRGDDVFKKTAVLSGGEKNRLTLVKLLLHPANLLLLDEPTNHLDLASKDVLLEALRQFGGTVLVVSHDKYFLEHLVEKVLELKQGNHRLHLGGWQAYQEALAREVPAESLRALAAAPSRSQLDRQDMKKREGQLRKLERQELGLLGQLEALEAEKLKLDTALSTPEVYSQGELAKSIVLQLDANRVLREQIQDRWEVVALEMEEVQAEMRR